jgi:hypothetical protein
MARRYKCRSCRAVIVVVPRGVVARRHFGAMAIGLACWLFGVLGLSAREVHRRTSDWGEPGARWRTLGRWLDAVGQGRLFPLVRAWPASFHRRQQAERVARTLEALAPPSMSASAEARLFEGAARAA